MKAIIVSILLLAVPALAAERSGSGQLVVVEKESMQRKLDEANSLISDLIGRSRGRDRDSVKLLKQLRATLDDARDHLASAPDAYNRERERERDWDRDRDRDRDGRDRDRYRDDNDRRVQVVVPSAPPPLTQQAPPPPLQPEVYPIADQALQNLLAAINQEAFPNDRIRVLQQAAPDNYFLVAQVQQLLAALTFPRDRLQAMRLLKPRILDTDHYFQLYASFEFPSDKAELRKILSQ